jgi:serine/threonine protein kinase
MIANEDKAPVDSRHGNSDIEDSNQKYVEISPNKRYIRFEELISQTGNIKFSYKAFDTRNGTEVIWQKICMSDLSESEQERISRSANYLKEVQHQHIMEYLSIWLTEEPRTLNLITTYLDSLKQ